MAHCVFTFVAFRRFPCINDIIVIFITLLLNKGEENCFLLDVMKICYEKMVMKILL